MHTSDERASKLLTVGAAVREYGIGRTTLYQLLKSGDVPAVKVGRATRIWRVDLERWLQSLPRYQKR